MRDETEKRGSVVLEQLRDVLDRIQSFRDVGGDGTYLSFLHGQAAGMVLALKILFSGSGALGDKAEDLAKSFLGEKGCTCNSGESEEENH